jgi:hypothetical protein
VDAKRSVHRRLPGHATGIFLAWWYWYCSDYSTVSGKARAPWLHEIWREAKSSLRRSDMWMMCGYSMPAYDTEVLRLLKTGGTGRPLTIFLLSPKADALQKRWTGLLPEASIICLPGLPEGIEP